MVCAKHTSNLVTQPPCPAVNTILTRIYGADRLKAHHYSQTLSSLGFAGTVVGMLAFGYLSDKIGRKFGMMTATVIVAVFSGLSAASKGANGSFGGMLAMLSACRFLLGIGVGAEYPCGSVSASEQSEEKGISKNAQHRWFTLATSTFRCSDTDNGGLISALADSMIDFGFVISSFVPLVLYWMCVPTPSISFTRNTQFHPRCGPNHLRAVWRLSLGLGVVPALLVLIWRVGMKEPERYRRDSMKNARIPYRLVFRRYGVSLAALSFTWFLYDFIV